MHEGHRGRMYEKLKSGGSLYEHELLEMLLYNAYPRVNTNPVAHALISAFGSLAAVLNAEVEELTAVKGVGEKVALYLKCVGKCFKRVAPENSGMAVLKNYRDFRNFFSKRMRGQSTEVLEFYCLQKNGRVMRVYTFTDNEEGRVEMRTDQLTDIIARTKPYGIFVVHNHPSGNPLPSENDNLFTMKAQAICSMYNVLLYDHCIYASDDQIYSYYLAGEIDSIRENFSVHTLVTEQYKKLKRRGTVDENFGDE